MRPKTVALLSFAECLGYRTVGVYGNILLHQKRSPNWRFTFGRTLCRNRIFFCWCWSGVQSKRLQLLDSCLSLCANFTHFWSSILGKFQSEYLFLLIKYLRRQQRKNHIKILYSIVCVLYIIPNINLAIIIRNNNNNNDNNKNKSSKRNQAGKSIWLRDVL